MNGQEFDKTDAEAGNQDNMAQPGDIAGDNIAAENPEGNPENPVSAEELEKTRAERDEARDKYIRLVAEFENFRKRNAKERMELIQTASKDTITALLEVLDDCDRASRQIETLEDATQIREGVELVFNKLRTTLQGRGLRVMESLNHEFDPELHDAIAEIPAPSEDLKGKILDVTEPGYYLNEKLIRHAKVIVGK